MGSKIFLDRTKDTSYVMFITSYLPITKTLFFHLENASDGWFGYGGTVLADDH